MIRETINKQNGEIIMFSGSVFDVGGLFSSASQVIGSLAGKASALFTILTDAELRPLLSDPAAKAPNIDSDALRKKITESPDRVVSHDFGPTLGTVYYIKADEDHDDLDQLVEAIHKKQPNPQRSRSIHAWVTSGPILTSRSGPDAIRHHRLFLNSLSRTDDYIRYTLDELMRLEPTKINLDQLMTPVIYNLLTRGLFGLDELPESLKKTFAKFAETLEADKDDQEDKEESKTDALSDYAKNQHTFLRSMRFTALLDQVPALAELRALYKKSADEFIMSQIEQVKKDLLTYSQNDRITNILSLSTIEVIKEQNPLFFEDRIALNNFLMQLANDDETLKEILSDEYLHTLPATLFAARNILWVIAAILYELGKKPDSLATLRETLEKYDLAADFSNVREVIEADKRANTFLHNLYMEGLRLQHVGETSKDEIKLGNPMFRYYIAEPFEFKDIKIPANSMVCILNGTTMYSEKIWGEKPETFNPARFFGPKDQLGAKARIPLQKFSRNPRICPGNVIAEYIAKTFVCHLAMNFDMKLEETKKPTLLRHFSLDLSERQVEQKERKTF